MKYIGAHVAATGGVENAPLNAQVIGATAFALFTRNQRQWQSKPLSAECIAAFRENVKSVGIEPHHILPHDSYLINIGCPREDTRAKSLEALHDEARRAEQLGVSLLNFHPGAHLNQISEEECVAFIATGMNEVIAATESVTLLIESTAGQGSHLGHRFEQIAAIIGQVKDHSRVGVCLDTCHLFAAGYDIRTPETWKATMAEFEQVIGLEYLKGMHLNDSKNELGSRVDRHQCIGMGHIGTDTFRHIMRDPRLDDMPLILETPDPLLWPREISTLVEFAGQ